MLKYSALTYPPLNLGDYVQTIAATSFLPKVDYYVNREEFSRSSSKQPSFMIANGWYMHNPVNFPPPENIKPFYISIHIEDVSILTEEVVAHFKRHGPIGCRDSNTFELMTSKGVPAYFSGCLTLTLKNRFTERTNNVYLVDVDNERIKSAPEYIKKKGIRVSHKFEFINKFLRYQKKYSLFTDLLLYRAQKTLDLYAKAKLVVTSRLHCYFPCLAFGTPVIFLIPDSHYSESRFINFEKHSNVYFCSAANNIDWSQRVICIEDNKFFLSELTKKAVEMQDNPLRYYPIERFCKGLWRPKVNFDYKNGSV